MKTKTDQELLRDYAVCRSEAAFTEVTHRYVDLVYSAAIRMVRDPHLAQDISQNVFLALAKSAAELTERPVLAGWLHRTTHHLAVKSIRSDVRRRAREQEAAAMNTSITSEPEIPWETIAPHLDDSLNQLNETDREAVLLRYFQGKSAREIAEASGISDEAAQKRVSRAVERLRECFAGQGLKVGAGGLISLMAAHGVEAAPTNVASAIGTALLQAPAAVPTTSSGIHSLGFSAAQKMIMTAAVVSLVGMAIYEFRGKGPGESAATPDSTTSVSGSDSTGAAGRATNNFAKKDAIGQQRRRGAKNLTELKEALRAALYKPWPSKYGVRSYPPEGVVQALMAFGADRKEAFATLLEAANDSDMEARQRAVSAMGLVGRPPTPKLGNYEILGEPASGVKPFLWDLLRANDKELSHLALGPLQSVGIEPGDIPVLADLLSHTKDNQLFRYLPEAIARTIAKDPVNAAPFFRDVEALMENQDTDVQFAGACALAKQEAGRNPKVLERLIAGLRDKDGLHALMAVETLEKVGSAAEPAVQALLAFADSAEEGPIKQTAYRAIGKIRQDLRAQFPEVDQSLKEAESVSKWNERFRLGNLSYEECLEAIKNPTFTASAAKELATMGASAKGAIPDLLTGLTGQDQMKREEIVKAIHEIDPSIVIERVNRPAVDMAAHLAYLEVTSKPETEKRKKALERLEIFRIGNTDWYTRQEVTTTAGVLAQSYPKAGRIFISKIVEKEPSLAELFPTESAR